MGAESSGPEMDKRPKREETNEISPVPEVDNSGPFREADVTPIPVKVDALKPELSLKRPLIREIAGMVELRDKTTVSQTPKGHQNTREKSWKFKFSVSEIHISPAAVVIVAAVILGAAGAIVALMWR